MRKKKLNIEETEEDKELKVLERQNKILGFFIRFTFIILLFEIPLIFLGFHIYSNYRANYVDPVMEEKITDDIMSANVVVTPTTTEEKDGKILRSYYTGASGFIFKREENKYYVFTCYHVAEGFRDYEILIIPDSIKNYENISSEYDDFREYPVATLEYINEATDVAILSFTSEYEWPTLKIAKNNPQKGDSLMIIQNPKSQIGVIHYGEVTSNRLEKFDCHDGRLPILVMKHNVHTLGGSSGSAVLNENMEVVGINMGGNAPVLKDNFIYGAMVPADALNSAINNWKINFRED